MAKKEGSTHKYSISKEFMETEQASSTSFGDSKKQEFLDPT